MLSNRIGRRAFVKGVTGAAAFTALGSLVTACQPQVIEKVVTKEVIREKEVEKIVTATPPAPKPTVELKWTQWWPWEMEPGLVAATEVFERENNCKFVKESLPWSGFVQKMLTLAAAGAMPDIFGVNGSHVVPYAYRDVLLVLSPFADRDHFSLVDYFETTIAIYHYPPGRLVALPDFTIPTNATFYNEELFQKAGVEVPPVDWTWDDVLPLAQALTSEEEHQFGADFGGGLPVPLFGAWGGSMADDLSNPTKATFDSPELEAMANWLIELTHTHKAAPSIDTRQEMGGSAQMMATNKLGFTLGSQMDAARGLIKATGLKWGETLSPRRRGLTPLYPECGAGYGAPAKSKDPELAWAFLSFACGPRGWSVRLPVEAESTFVGWTPALKSYALKTVEYAKEQFPRVPAMVQAVLEGWSYPWWILHPGWEEFWAVALNPIGEQIMRRDVSVSEGLRELNKKCQEMIDNPPPK